MKAFNATAVLQTFLSRTPADLAFHSSEFERALAADFTALGDNPADADALFSSLGIPALFAESSESQIVAWERVLRILQEADGVRYDAAHKGTPFYFLGVASYLGEDFERALFYMDCALEQDHRLHGRQWYRIPSGMFVRLDDAPEAQFGRELVAATRGLFEAWSTRVGSAGGAPLSLHSYRTRLVNYGVEHEPSLRSAVTAFLSFLLEVRPRQTQLRLASGGAGTSEPFFLHLFKGCLLFETLLRTSSEGRRVVADNPKATLGDLLASPPLLERLSLPAAPRGLGAQTFADVLAGIKADESAGLTFDVRAIRATWGLRNATGHSLAWPRRPGERDYERLFVLVLGGIELVVERLYAENLLVDGAA
jgi:hypothetical protein